MTAFCSLLLALVNPILAIPAFAAEEPPKGWQLEERPSRLNPELTDYLLWTGSLHETPGPAAQGVMLRPVLALECRQGDVAVWFDFGRFVGGGVVRISYRIGQGKLLTGEVTVSADHKTFGVWERDRAISFIRSLYGEPQLRLQVAIPGGEPLLGIFDLDGLEDAAKPLRDTCGW